MLYKHWYPTLKVAQYLRARYFILTALYNIAALLYFILNLPPLLFIVLLIIIITLITKIYPLSDLQHILPATPDETSKQMHIRLNR